MWEASIAVPQENARLMMLSPGTVTILSRAGDSPWKGLEVCPEVQKSYGACYGDESCSRPRAAGLVTAGYDFTCPRFDKLFTGSYHRDRHFSRRMIRAEPRASPRPTGRRGLRTLLERAYGRICVSPSIPSWNQIYDWLQSMAKLRASAA